MAPSSPAQVARNTAFVVAAPIALGTSLVTSVYNASANADGHQRASRVLGFVSGLASAGVGGLIMSKPDMSGKIGAATAAVGGLSIALALRATSRHSAIVAQQKEAERSRGVRAALSPVVGGRGTGSGVAVSIRY
jgi:hypothetical protein